MTMKEVSGQLTSTFNLLKKSFQLLLKPIADGIGLFLRPFAMQMIKFAIPVYKKFYNSDLFKAMLKKPEDRTDKEKGLITGSGIIGGAAAGAVAGGLMFGPAGFVGGGIAGGLTGAAMSGDQGRNIAGGFIGGGLTGAAIGGLAGGPVGAAVGGMIGSAIGGTAAAFLPEGWQEDIKGEWGAFISWLQDMGTSITTWWSENVSPFFTETLPGIWNASVVYC